jgi:hypothetical protein
MDNKEEEYIVSEHQPFDGNLKIFLPVNYFLFTKREQNPNIIVRKINSDFYGTDYYRVTPFYKAISNIL